ncbi:hypothetical protein Tco_0653009 [Tanacetum coccineum]|uniref:Uncharacterized protein n=1 Tax=Tanacetum coccineum TaxID=301880 RepID=A0ABQ4WZZ1_9ASTR
MIGNRLVSEVAKYPREERYLGDQIVVMMVTLEMEAKQLQTGHDNEIVLARVRISTLEMLIEDIQIYVFSNLCIMDMINNQDIEHMIPPTPPRDTETPVRSHIPLSPSSLVGSSSPVRSTTPPPDYPFDESIFVELDNSLWIILRPLESEPVLEKPIESDAC